MKKSLEELTQNCINLNVNSLTKIKGGLSEALILREYSIDKSALGSPRLMMYACPDPNNKIEFVDNNIVEFVEISNVSDLSS